MINMLFSILGTLFFIFGFIFVIACCVMIMRKEDENLRGKQYYE